VGSVDCTRRGCDEGLQAEGFLPKTVVLEKTILDHGVSTEISGKHYIMEGPVLKVHQLRYADDLLLKDETKYISLKLCPRINMLSTDLSYFKLYEDKYHHSISDIKQNLSAIILSPDDLTNNFEVSEALPVFVLNSVVLTQPAQVLELENSLYRGDKYKFEIIAHPEYNAKVTLGTKKV